MSVRTLFLAWQDKSSRQWFPIGRLDADVKRPLYRFRYVGGVGQAREMAQFVPLWEFPDLTQDYRSPHLFSLFRNRLMSSARPDREDYLRELDLHQRADEIEILTVSGGYRVTDAYEVFPRLVKGDDGQFSCRFFLHGWRHVSRAGQRRVDSLRQGERLQLTIELNNPATVLAVQIQTTDYHMIGWAPRYLVRDLAAAMAESPSTYEAEVVRVNPRSAPSRQRVLIEMHGSWKHHDPMTAPEFLPLVPA